MVVSHDSGQHAIPGESALRAGGDTVFSLDEGNYVQCFCPEDEVGVQTNWWQRTSLTQETIDAFSKLGWHFIPNGANWGLNPSNYLAQNSQFACHSESLSATLTNSNDVESFLNGGSSDENGSVLGLASTGTSKVMFGLLMLGAVALVGAGWLNKNRSQL